MFYSVLVVTVLLSAIPQILIMGQIPPRRPPIAALFEGSIMHKCEEELGITRDEIHEMHEMHESGNQPSEKCLCFVKCLAEKSGLIDENGKFNKDKLTDQMKSTLEEISSSVIPCLEKMDKPVTSCQDVVEIKKCFPKPT